MRAEHATGAGNIHYPAQAPVQGPEPVRSAESCQPCRKAYPSVSQVRRLLTELQQPFYIALRGVPHVIAATQNALLNKSDCEIGIVISDLRVYAIRIIFITKSIQI